LVDRSGHETLRLRPRVHEPAIPRHLGQGAQGGRLEAKAKGVKFGCKRTIDRKKLLALHESGMGATGIARQMGIGRSTVYKLLGEIGD
jgi:DNA invertase Pin-like site-specific DNA recombinase